MEPSVGRIVHYVSHGSPIREDGTQAFTSQCRAAIVTEVRYPDDTELHDSVALAVLNPTGMFFQTGVPHSEPEDEILVGGTWHWPEQVAGPIKAGALTADLILSSRIGPAQPGAYVLGGSTEDTPTPAYGTPIADQVAVDLDQLAECADPTCAWCAHHRAADGAA